MLVDAEKNTVLFSYFFAKRHAEIYEQLVKFFN